MYLDSLLQVDKGSSDTLSEDIKSTHFLDKNSVHALFVLCGVLSQRSLCIEVLG